MEVFYNHRFTECRGNWIPDRFSIPKSRDCKRPNPGISGLEFLVMSCVEKHALLLKYKLYVNAVVAELAGLKAALISIESLYNGVPWQLDQSLRLN